MRNRPPTHTIGVVGVRDFKGVRYDNVTYVFRTFEKHLLEQGLDKSLINVVTGGGSGVEKTIVEWCDINKVAYRMIPPNIQAHGARKAFLVRNNYVVSDSDSLVMFWDGCMEILTSSIATAMHQQKKATIYPLM